MAPWLTIESSYLTRPDIGEVAAGMRKCSFSRAGVSNSHVGIFDPTWTPQDRSSVRIERGGSPSSVHGSPSPSAEGGSPCIKRELESYRPSVCIFRASLPLRRGGLAKQTPATSDACRTLPRLTGRACVSNIMETYCI